MKRTVILGGGFGGIAVATELRRRLGDAHEAVLIDRRDRFTMGFRKLWDLVGIGSLDEGRRSRVRLAGSGIRFLQTEITAIVPAMRRVTTAAETLDADHIVVALGAVPRPDLVDGLGAHTLDVWTESGVAKARSAIGDFDGGRLLVLIAGAPYTCPPAPYECAMLLEEHLRERGVRDRTELSVVTFQPLLLPNAGREGSAWLAERLTERGIAFRTGCKIERIEAGRVVLADGEIPFDLAIGVPPHRGPEIVKQAGLAGPGGFVDVDPETLECGHDGIFAVGDVTRIELANGLPFPKAGVTAEAEGLRVASAIAARVEGKDPPAPFDGRGHCFLEMGRSSAARIDGEFFATPAPRVTVAPPSRENAEEKRRFESERLARWFGD